MKPDELRADIAKHVLGGILANRGFSATDPREAAIRSLDYADALIAELAHKPGRAPELDLGAVPAPVKKGKAPDLSDEDWLKSLEASPAYTGIEIRVQFAKMQQWCAVNGKTASRKRFINWLNRTERPIAAPGTAQEGDGRQDSVGPCPDWRERAQRLRKRPFRLSWDTHSRADVNLERDLLADMAANK